jgi:predicted HicB family RNase H-like nuclease
MKKPQRAKEQTLNLRVSAEFKERLAEEAARARRSITNYLEVTLQDFWDEQQSQRKVSEKRRRD